MLSLLIESMEKGLIPDLGIRFGIRRLCRERLQSLDRPSLAELQDEVTRYVEALRSSPVAVQTEDANRQHYELPAEFFNLVLGKQKKYSCSYFPKGCDNLDQAEEFALNETMLRAELKDGMQILELGCGWGSLTLAMARKFPKSQIVALSNSNSQREYIEAQLATEKLTNVRILTRNVANELSLGEEFGLFDRVVSVEMFEHLRNYELILQRISNWLKPQGKLFIHIFTHRQFSYYFDTEGEDNWMGKYFFTGGQMPAHQLMSKFQKDLSLQQEWVWDGVHYAKTSEAWLQNMDRHAGPILELFKKTYGQADAPRWVQRWRVFFLACAELFGYAKGTEWAVSHLPLFEEGHFEMIFLMLGLSLILFAISVARFFGQDSLYFWMTSIVATEAGHWFALACLVLIIILLARSHRYKLNAWAYLTLALLIISMSLFIEPLARFRSQIPEWSKQLTSQLGLAPLTTLPDYQRLILGTDLPAITPEPRVFFEDTNSHLELNFYRAASHLPAPWVLVIHGGGWDSGDATQLPELNSYLAARGYAVVSIAYRLAPQFHWPAPREDALRAVAYVKEHAGEMGIDTDHWVVLGRSAGGQIAESLAYDQPDSGLKGCIAFYSPADLNFAFQYSLPDDPLHSRALLRDYIGGDPSQKPQGFDDASPIRFVRPTSVMTLLLHGPNDPLVWYKQSERLIVKLHENKVPSALITIPWATHGFDFIFSGPGGQLSSTVIEAFLKKAFEK